MTKFQLAFATGEAEETYFTGTMEIFQNSSAAAVEPGLYRLTTEGALELVAIPAQSNEQGGGSPQPVDEHVS